MHLNKKTYGCETDSIALNNVKNVQYIAINPNYWVTWKIFCMSEIKNFHQKTVHGPEM